MSGSVKWPPVHLKPRIKWSRMLEAWVCGSPNDYFAGDTPWQAWSHWNMGSPSQWRYSAIGEMLFAL